MLRTAFIGQDNHFDHRLCEWLGEHTDLSIIIWTSKLSWSYGRGWERKRNVLRRFAARARKRGVLSVANEFLYYLLYRKFIQGEEKRKLGQTLNSFQTHPQKPIEDIPQVHATDIKSPELQAQLKAASLDALFAMCISVYLPAEVLNIPRLGSFLWHEGITPEYRGVYSPFWALLRKDYQKVGYTLLRMSAKLDAGDIYVQGQVQDADFLRDWHSYLGHKAILDSLPRVQRFLVALERGEAKPIMRPDAVDGYYSFPTATGLIRLATRRCWQRVLGVSPVGAAGTECTQ